MYDELSAHGSRFHVEAHGFGSRHEMDFNEVLSDLFKMLYKMEPKEVDRLHEILKHKDEHVTQADGEEYNRVLAIFDASCYRTLMRLGWERPSAVFLSVSPL